MSLMSLFVVLGGSVFIFLGVAHNVLSLIDVFRPSKIVPDSPQVIEAMKRSTVRLTRGQATVWDAWLGFNLSHGFGLILFGLVALASVFYRGGTASSWLLAGLVAWSLIFLLLSVRFFFRTPVLGTTFATASFLGAWILSLVGV